MDQNIDPSLKPAEAPAKITLSKEAKRHNHLTAEKRRRDAIRDAYKGLADACHYDVYATGSSLDADGESVKKRAKKQTLSKESVEAQTMIKAAEYIRNLEAEHQQLTELALGYSGATLQA